MGLNVDCLITVWFGWPRAVRSRRRFALGALGWNRRGSCSTRVEDGSASPATAAGDAFVSYLCQSSGECTTGVSKATS